MTQNNLGVTYSGLVTGDRAANLEKAKGVSKLRYVFIRRASFQKSTATLPRPCRRERQLRNLTSE